MERLTEQEVTRRQKVEDLCATGIEPFGYTYQGTYKSGGVRTVYEGCMKKELEEKDPAVRIAGRIMTRRRQGEVGFMHTQDIDGQTQIYVRKNVIGEEAYEAFKKLDLGDIVGIEGKVTRTDHGELSVKAEVYTHLTKVLRPLPEKYHGLQDVEGRFRHRHVDLITNENSKRITLTKPKIIRATRNHLDGEGLVEVGTPVLQPVLGGASTRSFVTHHSTLDMPFYLRITAELPLEKLIVGGLEGVYEIGRLSCSKGMDATHNPEFIAVEAHVACSDLSGMMDLMEGLLNYVAETVYGTTEVEWQDKTISLEAPFKRLHVMDGIRETCGVDFRRRTSLTDACAIVEEHDIKAGKKRSNVGYIISLLFERYVKETLVQPIYVYGHLVEISPLAKKNARDLRLADRYELFIDEHEYMNAFSELNDPIDQRGRLENQLELRDLGDDEVNKMNTNYVETLEYGLPPTGGVGSGIDRLVMLLTDSQTIREVLLSLHMCLNEQSNTTYLGCVVCLFAICLI